MDTGSYFAGANGIGPVRHVDVRVYDLGWNQMFSHTGTVSTTQQISTFALLVPAAGGLMTLARRRRRAA